MTGLRVRKNNVIFSCYKTCHIGVFFLKPRLDGVIVGYCPLAKGVTAIFFKNEREIPDRNYRLE